MAAQASRMAVGGCSRVAVESLDEFALAMVTWSNSGFKDEWDQVDAGGICQTFLLFAFGHVA